MTRGLARWGAAAFLLIVLLFAGAPSTPFTGPSHPTTLADSAAVPRPPAVAPARPAPAPVTPALRSSSSSGGPSAEKLPKGLRAPGAPIAPRSPGPVDLGGARWAPGGTTPAFGGSLLPSPEGAGPGCDGPWPSPPTGAGVPDPSLESCAAHDAPGLDFYSELPGSGGNVSWTVTLPVDRSPTANQSDLYSAAWFGLALSDPSAWLDECFLELQFYPDLAWQNVSGFSSPVAVSQNGNWVGAAVAWQIDAATGHEDPCFYEPLYLNGHPGPLYLDMAQGDRVLVTLTGWVGSATGENITVVDATNGERTSVTLYNASGGYPLDPAYATNSFPNALEWSPGGEYPAVFAFDTGRAANPTVSNGSAYHGCNPGPPRAGNVAVPCPSYDPASWANDTLTPWHIAPPTFFDANTRTTAAQVAFTQDFGGIGLVNSLANATCDGLVGSAWCSYPWYSYSCGAQAFEFGATDYPGVSEDFGAYREFASTEVENDLGISYYPPTNFSVPSCTGPSDSLSVGPISGTGSVSFLSTNYRTLSTVGGLSAGEYSVVPTALGGDRFESWSVTGDVSLVTPPNDPWATIAVTGNGSVVAAFGAAPATTTVTFATSGSTNARVVVSGGSLFSNGIPLATELNAGSVALAPGVYGIEALGGVAANFSAWSVSDAGALVAAPALPSTWLVVTGGSSAVVVTASFAVSTSVATVTFGAFGSGSVLFNRASTSGNRTESVPVGGYTFTATPSAGWYFRGWVYDPTAALTDYRATMNASLEAGATTILAVFSASPVPVTFTSSPASGGSVELGAPGGSALFATEYASLELPPSYGFDLTAVPAAGYAFVDWTVSNAGTIRIAQSSVIATDLLVRSAGNVTAVFAPAARENVQFFASPAQAGNVLFNAVNNLSSGARNDSVGAGSFVLGAAPAPGFAFVAWTVTGALSVGPSPTGGYLARVTGSGSLTAQFRPVTYGLTFVANSPIGVTAAINGTAVTTGTTLHLVSGVYPLSVSVGSSTATFVEWRTSPGLTVANASLANTTVTVAEGAGTLYAVVVPFGVTMPVASRPIVEVGANVTFSTSADPNGPYSYLWQGLPGCPPEDTPVLSCVPTTNGSFTVLVTVTNAAGMSATFSTSVQVHAALQVVALSLTEANDAVNGPVTFSLSTAGGVGPFEIAYSGLPPGCASANLSSLPCTPTSTGHYEVGVRVSDAFGKVAVGFTNLTVSSPVGTPAPRLGGYWTWILILIIAGIVVVLLLVLVGRRREPPGPLLPYLPPPPAAYATPPAAWDEGTLPSTGDDSGPAVDETPQGP